MNMDSQLEAVRLLLPVKAFDRAKSRLALPDRQRTRVARLLFAHTLGISLQCLTPRQVVVMTSDPVARKLAARRGVKSLSDPSDDLNTSLEAVLHVLRKCFPASTLAVTVSDLPGLTAPILYRALRESSRSSHPAVVVDQHGTGTTFLSIPPKGRLPMHFGRNSARKFTEAGAVPLLFPPPGITHDLDVLSDLHPSFAIHQEDLCPSTSSP